MNEKWKGTETVNVNLLACFSSSPNNNTDNGSWFTAIVFMLLHKYWKRLSIVFITTPCGFRTRGGSFVEAYLDLFERPFLPYLTSSFFRNTPPYLASSIMNKKIFFVLLGMHKQALKSTEGKRNRATRIIHIMPHTKHHFWVLFLSGSYVYFAIHRIIMLKC